MTSEPGTPLNASPRKGLPSGGVPVPPGERYLRSVLLACDELGDKHTDPQAWAAFKASTASARVILSAERFLSDL